MSDVGFVAPSVADSYIAGIPPLGADAAGSVIITPPPMKGAAEPLSSSLIQSFVGLALVFVFLLVFLSVDNVSTHYASASTGNRAKFAFWLALFMVSIYNLVSLIYRILTRSGNPNSNLLWIFGLLLVFSILSVTYWTIFST